MASTGETWRTVLFRAFSAMLRSLFGTRAARAIWKIPGSRGLYRLLISRLRPERVTIDGHTLQLDPLDSLLLSVNGNYEEHEQALFVDCIRPGDTVLDVGAHIGLYTLQAARAVGPTGRVLAFEPSSVNHALLEENVTANGYANVTVINAAVSDSTGTAELALSADNTGDHSLRAGSTRERVGERVDTVTIDGVAAGSRVDVVKMDIQGAEPAALVGARGTLAANSDVILFTELSPAHLADWGGASAFLADLDRLGFELFEIIEETGAVEPRTATDLADWRGGDHADLVCAKGADARDRLLKALGARSMRRFV